MKFTVSAENAIRCVKFFVDPIVCWPPPISASKFDLLKHDVLLLIAISLPVACYPPLISHVAASQDNVPAVTKTLAIMIAVSFTIFKMIMCRYHRGRLQIFFAELDDFVKAAGQRERALLERYMDRCGPLYTFIGVSAIATCFSFICGPLVLPQPLPADVPFPFEVEGHPIRWMFLYIGETFVGIQAISAVIVDFEVALLLWFSGIRFELLAEDFTMVASLSEFNRCVEKHQELLVSATDVIQTVRYMILAVAAVTTLGNICAGYQFVHGSQKFMVCYAILLSHTVRFFFGYIYPGHQPIAVLAQFFFMLSVMSMEVLMYAWPADNLMTTSGNIAHAAFSSKWFGTIPEIQKSILIVMMRAQRPLVVSIGGLLPELTLDFYGKYLTTSFSYFTTLQAVAG